MSATWRGRGVVVKTHPAPIPRGCRGTGAAVWGGGSPASKLRRSEGHQLLLYSLPFLHLCFFPR